MWFLGVFRLNVYPGYRRNEEKRPKNTYGLVWHMPPIFVRNVPMASNFSCFQPIPEIRQNMQ